MGEFGGIRNYELRPCDLPSREDGQLAWLTFALTFDGYEEKGGFDKCLNFAEGIRASWESTGALPTNISDLRTALFMEQRGWRLGGEGPLADDAWRYWSALVAAMRELLPISGSLHPSSFYSLCKELGAKSNEIFVRDEGGNERDVHIPFDDPGGSCFRVRESLSPRGACSRSCRGCGRSTTPPRLGRGGAAAPPPTESDGHR